MKKKIMIIVFIIYIAVLLKITIFRSGFGTYELMQNGKINAIPIINLIKVLKNNPLFFIYIFVGNIIWFIPLGFFLRKLTKLKTIYIVMLGVLLSLIIEMSQYVFGVGESELDDLILNTIGTWLGVAVGKLTGRLNPKSKQYLLSNIHIVFAVVLIVMTVMNFAVKAFGYSYVPVSYIAHFILIGVLFGVYTVVSCVFAKIQSAKSRKMGALSIMMLFLYFVSAVYITETNQMYVTNGSFPCCALFCVMYFAWVIIFFSCVKNKKYRMVVYGLSLLFSILMSFVLFITFIFGGFGVAERLGDYVYSPDGKYCTWAELYDEGALGGSESVYLRQTTGDVNLGIGRLKTVDMRIDYNPNYNPEYYSIEWQDNETLLINGEAYDVDILSSGSNKDIKSYAAKGYISHMLGVNIRKGTVITYTDNHGGFHGDGMTFAAISFSDETVSTKISENRYWNALPLTENLTALAYGITTENSHRGPYLRDENEEAVIPEIQNGYYYFLDRHSESTDRHDDSEVFNRYSYNFILAIYDADTNILYYTKFDT